MRRKLLIPALALVGLTLTGGRADAQTASDSAAIRATALDYIEGWYSGDAARMERALHPELAKRIVQNGEGGSRLGNMGASDLVRMTRGRPRGGALGRRDVRVLNATPSSASLRIDADDWIDLLHLARWNGEWKIVNVLWEMRDR